MEALKMVEPQKQEVNQMMSEEEIEKIIQALQDYINETGISQSKLSKQLGYSGSTLSQVLSNKYNGDMENFCIKARKHLNLQQRKAEAPKRPNFVKTEIAQEVLMVLNFVQINYDLGVIVGDPGIGKTTTIKKFVEENPNCEYFAVSPATKTPIAFLDEMLEIMGKSSTGGMNAKQKILIKALQGSEKMFVIDEAQHLTPSTLETIRFVFHDEAKIPVVLAGNPLVLDQMGKGKRAEFAQFFSRIGIRRRLIGRKSKKDVRMIVNECVTEPDDDMIIFLYRKANQFGGFGYMIKHLILGMSFAYENGDILDINYLKAAEEMLEGE